MIIAARFMTAKGWKQLKRLETDTRIIKMWSKHTTGYF